MGNKYIYICKKADRCDASEYQFFETVELLYGEYIAGLWPGQTNNLTKSEFIESIENEELVEEMNSEFYRDVVVTE